MFERTALIGAGAVGASIAAMMIEAGVPLTIVADRARARRIADDGLTVNGRLVRPPVDPEASGGPYPFVIVATKSTHLERALPLVTRAAGSEGVVLSLLNGISSEGLIRDALTAAQTDPSRRVVPAMILGIDAVRSDSGVTYLNRGTIHYGADPARAPVPDAILDAVQATFDAAAIPARRAHDITRTLWWKFMINVGINQASAVLGAPYGLFQDSDAARDLMLSAMEEVLELSERAGTGLSRADLDAWLETLAGLDPGGKTSMLQDVEANRPTEVDLFAGTVLELAERYAVDVPVNRTLYRIVRALESRS
ncbi:MAG: ketopantoate reductase family protein [Spirochaetota bacterium]